MTSNSDDLAVRTEDDELHNDGYPPSATLVAVEAMSSQLTFVYGMRVKRIVDAHRVAR